MHDHPHEHSASCSHGHHHHGHGGGHHHHIPKNFGWRFALAASLNMLFVGAELAFGYITQSLALIADAVHNFSDVIGLLLAWGALWLAKLPPTADRTYGYRGASFLAALANAALLFLVTGALVLEAIDRFKNPTIVASDTVIIVATIGILINGATAMLFWKEQQEDINIRGAFLHMMADMLVSVGVVLGAYAYIYTGYGWIDPALTLLIAGVIFYSSWGLASDALRLSMAAVPKHIDTNKVKEFLKSLPDVVEVHDLHIWAMSTTETAMTAHIVRGKAEVDDDFLHNVTDQLLKRFQIHHPTIQVESGKAGQCRLVSEAII